MKKSFLLFAYGLIAIFVISSCSDSGTNPASNNEIWPLKVGNYWKLETTSYDSNAVIKGNEIMKFEVVGEKILNTGTAYIIEMSSNSENDIDSLVVMNKSDGLYVNYDFDFSQFEMLFKHPGVAGEKYVSAKDTAVILSTNYTFKTKAGTFSCYQYSLKSEYRDDQIMFAPGKGYIGELYYRAKSNGSMYIATHTELIEYMVK